MRKKILITLLLFAPLIATADVKMDPAVEGSVWDFLSRTSNYILIVSAFVVAPLLYLAAAFFLFTATGDSEKLTRAKKLFLWTSAGLIVIGIARGFFAYLANIF